KAPFLSDSDCTAYYTRWSREIFAVSCRSRLRALSLRASSTQRTEAARTNMENRSPSDKASVGRMAWSHGTALTASWTSRHPPARGGRAQRPRRRASVGRCGPLGRAPLAGAARTDGVDKHAVGEEANLEDGLALRAAGQGVEHVEEDERCERHRPVA